MEADAGNRPFKLEKQAEVSVVGRPMLLFSKWLFEKLLLISSQWLLLWNFSLRRCDRERGYKCILKCSVWVPVSFLGWTLKSHDCTGPHVTPLCDSKTLLLFFISFQFWVSQVMLWLFSLWQASMSAKFKVFSFQLLAPSQVVAYDPRLHLKWYSRLLERENQPQYLPLLRKR